MSYYNGLQHFYSKMILNEQKKSFDARVIVKQLNPRFVQNILASYIEDIELDKKDLKYLDYNKLVSVWKEIFNDMIKSPNDYEHFEDWSEFLLEFEGNVGWKQFLNKTSQLKK